MTEKTHTEVEIHIDREPYLSPRETTGAALYILSGIGPGKDLFLEAEGETEDRLIPNDHQPIHLKDGQHFYSQKDVKLFVNTREKEVPGPRVTFGQIATLAYPQLPDGQTVSYLILYKRGPKQNPEGSLLNGESIFVKNGMIFDVTPTNKS